MRIIARWSRNDVECVRRLWSKYRNTEYQKAVRRRNLAVPWRRPPDDEIRDLLVRCILTSQQPSGPGSVHARAFDGVAYGDSALSIRRLASARDPHAHASAFLRRSGFRAWERRGRWISDNFAAFVTDGKCRIIDQCAAELARRRGTAAGAFILARSSGPR